MMISGAHLLVRGEGRWQRAGKVTYAFRDPGEIDLLVEPRLSTQFQLSVADLDGPRGFAISFLGRPTYQFDAIILQFSRGYPPPTLNLKLRPVGFVSYRHPDLRGVVPLPSYDEEYA